MFPSESSAKRRMPIWSGRADRSTPNFRANSSQTIGLRSSSKKLRKPGPAVRVVCGEASRLVDPGKVAIHVRQVFRSHEVRDDQKIAWIVLQGRSVEGGEIEDRHGL